MPTSQETQLTLVCEADAHQVAALGDKLQYEAWMGVGTDQLDARTRRVEAVHCRMMNASITRLAIAPALEGFVPIEPLPLTEFDSGLLNRARLLSN